MRLLLRSALLFLGALLVTRPATAGDVEDARQHFAEGVKRYEEGDYEAARALFRQADAEHHAAVIVYNIARAEERLTHPQAAVDAYEAYLGEAGERGELAHAAVMAIARIKASSRLLRIETKPAGARLFVDGAPTREVAPTRILVRVGRHHVVAEGEGWRAEAEVDTGASKEETVTLAAPEASAAAAPAPAVPPVAGSAPPPEPPPAAPPSPSAPRPAPSVTPPPTFDGLVFGAQFQVIPHRFESTDSSGASSFGVAAGLMLEGGYAASEDFLVLGRALAAIGSRGVPATSLGTLGVALSYRMHRRLWLGAAFQGGRAILPGAITPAPDEQRRFDTDIVFCPALEVSVVVLEKPYGQWLLSASPAYFFAGAGDSNLFFVPIGFGLRAF